MADKSSLADSSPRVREALETWGALGLLAVAQHELDDARGIISGSTARAQADIHQPPLSGIDKAAAVMAIEIRHALEHVLNTTAMLTEALRLVDSEQEDPTP